MNLIKAGFIAAAVLFWLIIFNPAACAQKEPPLPLGLDKNILTDNQEPSLPSGLEDTGASEEPTLPTGLESDQAPEEPALPAGLESQTENNNREKEQEITSGFPFDFFGFWEARVGMRTQEDKNEKDFSIGETRLQLQLEKSWELIALGITADFITDPVLDLYLPKLEKGEGFLDLREANLLLRPSGFVDLKVGRQILTWGTGDLIFINDLFPKDWNSFFIGRDTEYLKAPSDALKTSLFSKISNLDIIYTPRFDADRFIDGRRLSFFNSSFGKLTGRDSIVSTNAPDNWFSDDEIAWRVYKNIFGYEPAFYGYRGFWKSPAGIDPATGKATFPALSVYGASVRGTVGGGIGNLELGYYNSEDDKEGNNSSIRNSEFRFLTGYEIEAARDFTVGVQYYLEHLMNYINYIKTLPSGSPPADENRHVLTFRLTKLLLNQNMILSLFTFYSPSDSDAYLRPKIHYKIDDHWSTELGGNVFIGKDNHTFFGQFKKNNNVYIGLRYGF